MWHCIHHRLHSHYWMNAFNWRRCSSVWKMPTKYVLHRLSFWEMIAPVIIDIRLWGIRSDFPSLSNPSDKYKRSTFGSIYYFSSEEAIIKIYLFNLDKNLVLLNSIFFFFFPSINCYWSYIIWGSSYAFFCSKYFENDTGFWRIFALSKLNQNIRNLWFLWKGQQEV